MWHNSLPPQLVGKGDNCSICFASACMSTTSGCPSVSPPSSTGRRNGAPAWPGGRCQAALCTRSHRSCKSSSSASVQGTSGAEYQKRLVHAMCIAGTIWPTRYWWCLALPTSSVVAFTTCCFSTASPGEETGTFLLPILTRMARTPRYGKLSSAGRRVRAPLVSDLVRRELIPSCEIVCSDDRLDQLDPHPGPGTEVGHHSLAGAVAPRAEALARVGFGPGGLAVVWRSLVRVEGRRRTPPARRPRLAREGGPRAQHRGQRACSLESSCPSPFVRSSVPYVTRPAVGPSWGTNCARRTAASGRRVHRGY